MIATDGSRGQMRGSMKREEKRGMMTKGMYSSKTGIWETPQDFFDELDREFQFTLDACAMPENAKCEEYYTPEQDGLSQPWNGTVWCNPPYGREIGKWIRKGFESADGGATVVMLLPARTDTRWFHDYIYHRAEIRFVRGRLRFSGADAAPFPSMVCVFRPPEPSINAINDGRNAG